MGDRCYVSAYILATHATRFIEVWNADKYACRNDKLEDILGECDTPGFLWFEEGDANGGCWDTWEEAAAAGIIFFGQHGDGNAYPGCEFIGIGGKLFDLYSPCDAGPMIQVQYDEKLGHHIPPGSMRCLIEYDTAYRKIERIKATHLRLAVEKVGATLLGKEES